MTDTAGGDALKSRIDAVRAAPTGLPRAALFSVGASVVFNLCRFGAVVLLAKFAGPQWVGAFDFASVAVAAPIVMFLALELRAAYVADAHNEFPFGAYRALRRIGLVAAAILVCAALALRPLPDAPAGALAFMLAIGLGRVTLNSSELYYADYQRRERLDRLATANLLRGIAMLAPFAILLPIAASANAGDSRAIGRSATLAATVCAVGWIAVWLLYDRRWTSRRHAQDAAWTWSQVLRLAWRALPLGCVILMIHLCDSVPRWVMAGSGASADALGYFGAMRVVTLGVGLVMIQIATAAGNRLVVYFHADRSAFLRLAGRLLAIALALGVTMIAVAWALGEWFLGAAFSPEYAERSHDFIVLVAAQSVSLLATVLGFMTTQIGRFWIQVPVQAGILAATTLAALWFVPSDPVGGAALTAVTRSVVHVALYACVVAATLRATSPAPHRSL